MLKRTRIDRDELQNAVVSAHEASERTLGHIKDIYSDFSYYSETGIPIPLTTGKRGTQGASGETCFFFIHTHI